MRVRSRSKGQHGNPAQQKHGPALCFPPIWSLQHRNWKRPEPGAWGNPRCLYAFDWVQGMQLGWGAPPSDRRLIRSKRSGSPRCGNVVQLLWICDCSNRRGDEKKRIGERPYAWDSEVTAELMSEVSGTWVVGPSLEIGTSLEVPRFPISFEACTWNFWVTLDEVLFLLCTYAAWSSIFTTQQFLIWMRRFQHKTPGWRTATLRLAMASIGQMCKQSLLLDTPRQKCR